MPQAMRSAVGLTVHLLEGGRIIGTAALVAATVNADGMREIVGLDIVGPRDRRRAAVASGYRRRVVLTAHWAGRAARAGRCRHHRHRAVAHIRAVHDPITSAAMGQLTEPPPQNNSGREHASFLLSRHGRTVSAGASLVASASGTLAVFVSDNEAGTVALLAAAALFGLTALAGRLPVRVKWGDKEVQYAEALARGVRDAVDADPDSPTAGRLIQAVVQAQQLTGVSSVNVNAAIASRDRAIEYERAIGRAIAVALPGIAVEEAGPARFDLDYIVRSGDRSVGLMVKWTPAPRPLPTAVIHAAAFATHNMTAIQGVVIVSNSAARPDFREMGLQAVHYAYVPTADNSEELLSILTELLRLSE